MASDAEQELDPLKPNTQSETDKLAEYLDLNYYMSFDTCYFQAWRLARRLERERDDARAQNTELRAIAEAAFFWLNQGNPDDVSAGARILAKLEQIKEASK